MAKTIEEKRSAARKATQEYRARQKSLGISTNKPYTEEQRAHKREYIAERRRKAKEDGRILPGDDWARRNQERHKQNTRNWRAANFDRSQEVNREIAAKRRSTPWGKINNRLWPMLHNGVASTSCNKDTKYYLALGYTWRELRIHLEGQFLSGMTWLNWGEVWELDHIVPLSTFKYEGLTDPLFKEAWALKNLRPLWRHENQFKGNK